ncbi:putative quinol monooxygenase YgiN [Maioricimonas rarisocia]|uniref:Putative quinol monooxygenase YgiN n=1 Tax=Maioricimonas rarisocia TaxID=2528026 RepID=A0A517Z7F2_9PLAN|nr:putative quinol monooxygenase [Maioricimonas rarisocia]QDU38416.1 putative quinol monooxygenase YgiN [Maioricimonas rarisocia]
MIHVIATIRLQPGTRARFLEEFHGIVPDVHAEAGCIEYGPAVDLATDISAQPEVDENAVMVIEKWESLEHLKQHLQAPHMLTYRERVKDLVIETRVQILEPA